MSKQKEIKEPRVHKLVKNIKAEAKISGKLVKNTQPSTPKLMEAIKKIYKEKYLDSRGFRTSRPTDLQYDYSTRSNNNCDLNIDSVPIEENKEWDYPLCKPVQKKVESTRISKRKLSRSSCSKSKKELGMDFLELRPNKIKKPK